MHYKKCNETIRILLEKYLSLDEKQLSLSGTFYIKCFLSFNYLRHQNIMDNQISTVISIILRLMILQAHQEAVDLIIHNMDVCFTYYLILSAS